MNYFTYNAFDSNPVFWADPSGADVKLSGVAAQDYFRRLKDYFASKPEKDKEEEDDWIYDEEKEEYVWDEDVKSADDIDSSSGTKYIGKNISDIINHYNGKLSYYGRLKKFFNFETALDHVDFDSYLSAKLTPIIEKAFSSQRAENASFISDPDDYRNFFNSISTNLDPLLPKRIYSFSGSLNIGGTSIIASMEFTNRNRNVNFVTQVTSEGTYSTSFGSFYKNAFHISRASLPNIKVYNLSDKNYNFLDNYIWNKN